MKTCSHLNNKKRIHIQHKHKNNVSPAGDIDYHIVKEMSFQQEGESLICGMRDGLGLVEMEMIPLSYIISIKTGRSSPLSLQKTRTYKLSDDEKKRGR